MIEVLNITTDAKDPSMDEQFNGVKDRLQAFINSPMLLGDVYVMKDYSVNQLRTDIQECLTNIQVCLNEMRVQTIADSR